MLADAVGSGEKFLQPCGALSEGKERVMVEEVQSYF
jgi:hypothetical protein